MEVGRKQSEVTVDEEQRGLAEDVVADLEDGVEVITVDEDQPGFAEDGEVDDGVEVPDDDDRREHTKNTSEVKTTIKCGICDEIFTRRSNLKRHYIRKHDGPLEDHSSLSKAKCVHPQCDKIFYHKSKMMKHMEEEHQVKSTTSHHSFGSEKEFQDWKEKEEMKHNVYFSKRCGSTERKETKYTYFFCQQDGSDQPHRAHDKPPRKTDRRNKKGQIKTGSTCPANMTMHTNSISGLIDVTYVRTHSHEPSFRDTQHHPIPKSVRADIESKLSLGVPVTQIRRDLRDGLGERENRDKVEAAGQLRAYQFISKRIMHEMSRKLNFNARLHPQDNMSTYLLINRLEKENFNPILMYKPQGDGVFVGDPAIGDLPHAKDLFAVGIQTKEQLDMMHDKEILCIDATHGTNQYGYSLTNLIVPDEFHKGYPVGHLISNYTDEKTIYYFFKEIKKRAPNLVISTIMSDDDYSGPNAIKAVFGQDIKHLLCKWHVHRAWQRKLKQHMPTNDSQRNEIYQCLILLLEEKSTVKFEELASAFKEKYTPVCESFVKYFNSNYMNRPEAWAMCHRNFPHAKTDTNMYVEAYHNRLKTHYMKRQTNRRIDDLMNLLLEMEEEDFWRRKCDLEYKSSAPQQAASKESRHRRGLQISDQHLEIVDVSSWRVKSQSQDDIWHSVTAIQEKCDQDFCFEKCQELACLNLCCHLYHCNCGDNSLLCKHIHKVHAFLVRIHQKARTYMTDKEDDDDMNDDVDDIEDVLPLTTTNAPEEEEEMPAPSERMLQATTEGLATLEEMLQNEVVVKSLLPHINGTVKRLISQCTAVITANEKHIQNQPPLHEAKKIAPNQKLQLQLQPIKKAPKRKSAPPAFTGPTAAQKKDLLDALLTGSKKDNSTCANQPPPPPLAKKSKLTLKKTMAVNQKRSNMKFDQKPKQTKEAKKATSIPNTCPKKVIGRTNSISKAHSLIQTNKPASVRNVLPPTHSSVTPRLPASLNPTNIIIRNGPHNLSWVNLKSLEPTMSRGQQMSLKAWANDFKAGWLYDEVINSFFWTMQENMKHVLFAPSTTMTAIVHGSSTRRLWSDTSLEGKEFVFMPWNPSGNHWVLFAVDVKRNALMFLDPLVNGNSSTMSNIAMTAAEKISTIFEEKFSTPELEMEQPAKTLQRDGSSCGVFVCYYGELLATKMSLKTALETTKFRRHIYATIVGNCRIKSLEARKTCGVCKDVDSEGILYWVECSRCHQWYHCSCVGITHEEAQSLQWFYCKS